MNKNELIDWIITISLVVFVLFIIYQILRILLGGSWSTENIVIILVMTNLGYSFSISKDVKGIQHDLRNLQKGFNALAADFKKHLSDRKIHRD